MKKRDLNRAMVESVVNRALREMEQDSQRSARKLVDLALMFAKGPFERHFLTLCQGILEDAESPYYKLIARALQKFDWETLVTFGVNLGFEGCSRGAQRIRDTEAREGFDVPWALEFHVGRDGLARSCVQRAISEAMALGVHVFFLWDCGLAQCDLLQLCRENPTCAFAVLTTGSRGPDWNLAQLSQVRNLLFSVQGEAPLALELCQALEAQRMPYAVHLPYGNDLSSLPERLEKLRALGGLVAVLYNQDADRETQQAVYRQILSLRTSRACPFGLFTLPGDLLAIDKIISDNPCTLSFLPNGQAVTALGPTDSNIRTASLPEILRRELPRQAD